MSKQQEWIFKRFIQANEEMLKCFEKQDPEEFKGTGAAKAAGVCQREKQKVKDILNGNDMTMTRLVQDRVAILRALNASQAGKYMQVDEPVTRYH